ncbi:MAG: sensor histidine kinase, partial [Cellulosilyticaceae bacterium]
ITQKLDDEIREELHKYEGIIAQNGRRLIKLVNNLIDTTKINSGNFEYKPTTQCIVSFVEDLCLSVADFVERNNLEIIFDTDVEEKMLTFDMHQMERIMLNLISNAIKFNQPDGKIEVTIATENRVIIRVKDSGIGIPQDRLESVFQRFVQVDKSLRREKEGSGIGLALVKSLVEMHGGKIKVGSTLGKGSEFVITLPDVSIPEEIEAIAPEAVTMSNNYKIDVEFSDIYC